MTYALSLVLQEGVWQALANAPQLVGLIDGRVYDAPPHAAAPDASDLPYVTLGDEEAEAWSAGGLEGAVHDLTISVHARGEGFAEAKRIGAAISEALTEAPPPLAQGRVAMVEFLSARTRRLSDGRRRIDLRFRFRVHK
ncbi:DUF3168 domain-containing protein [Oceanicella actignis]|uniref:DUF3168 domain-containing protein n=1 Tax=Oceanicella actignis TaxID=1189325 RepID=A0A1M7TZM7_9RHOB|nr:DUF3168 domain-containing protein [Oceanicella actignis]TYO85048.1 uncharacterized protein DUF3168 [Oceanicella actignis]SET83474.1 Protein of unknown function [Oceanicella actignis]SHN76211.1 Protein of unknown function [Oceanicella actignis]